MKKNLIKPAPGLVLTEDVAPDAVKKLAESSKFELANESEHSQLKLGRVLAVGADKCTDSGFELESPAETGDIVAYQSLSAHNIRLKGVQYRLVEFEHIKAVIGE